MTVLDKMTLEEIKQVIPDKEDLKKLKKDEPFFRIVSSPMKAAATDELVDIEIALRKCERTGFFRN